MGITEIFDHIEKIDLTILNLVNELIGDEFDALMVKGRLTDAADWKVKGLPEQMENLKEMVIKYYPTDKTKDFDAVQEIVTKYLEKYPYYWENMEKIFSWARHLQQDLISVRVCKFCDGVCYPSHRAGDHRCKGRTRWKDDLKSMSPGKAPKFYPPYYRDMQKFIKTATSAPYNIPADYREMELLLQLYSLAKGVRKEISDRKQEEANGIVHYKWTTANGILISGAYLSEPQDLFPSRQLVNIDDIRQLLTQETQLQAERDAIDAQRPDNYRTKAARIWRDETLKPKLEEFSQRADTLRKTRFQLLLKYLFTAHFPLLIGNVSGNIPISCPSKDSYHGSYQPNFSKGWNTATNQTLDAFKAFETDTEDFRKPYLTCHRRHQISVIGSEVINTKYSTIYRREGVLGLFSLIKQKFLPHRVPQFIEMLKGWYLYPYWHYPRYGHHPRRDYSGIGELGLNSHLQVIAKELLDLFLAP